MFSLIVLAAAFTASYGLLSYDHGYPGRYSGFGDVNGDGKADFCRFICPKAVCIEKDVVFCCHLNGQTDQCGYSSQAGFESGKSGKPAALIDANGDGRADYCRILTPTEGGDAIPYCRIAGKTGWTEDEVVFNFNLGENTKFKKRL